MTPLLSVVMAVHNGDSYLDTSIRSVLQQSFDDFEFVIVNDGSSDRTSDIISAYKQQDSRIRAFNQPQQGLVASLNRGCALANGKYIARLDSDDIAKEYRLELQARYLENNPEIALVGGATECIDAEGNISFVMRWPGRRDGLNDFLMLDCSISHTTVMFRKDVFDSVGGYRHIYLHAEDYDLFLRIGDQYVLDNLPTIVCQYRLHGNQLSQQNFGQQILSAIGARIATRERRANRPEPTWGEMPISRNELKQHGVKEKRIDSLVSEYRKSNMYQSVGWRWRSLPFCEVTSQRMR